MLQFRKSKSFAPFRIALSKSGMPKSLFAGPVGISRSSDGTVRRTGRAQGTGFYDTTMIRPSRRHHEARLHTTAARPLVEPGHASADQDVVPCAQVTHPTPVDGYGYQVGYDGRALQIVATSGASRVALLGTEQAQQGVSIPVAAISGASYRPASALTKGRLIVGVTDGRSFAIHFRRKQQKPFREIVDALFASTT